jgi:hypothetical protein
MNDRLLLGCLAAGTFLATMAGCGPKLPAEGPVVGVHGRLTKAGQPLVVQGMDGGEGMIRITFSKYEGEGKAVAASDTYSAMVDANGNFKFPGRFGNGIPPGKYRVSVRQWEPFPAKDLLEGKFDEQHSPLFREVTGKESLEIDLSKP